MCRQYGWFLPWMSLAIAPPTVTYFVPGLTGRKKAERYGEVENLSQRDTCLATQNAGQRIEMQQMIHAASTQQRAVFEQAHIPV